VKPAERVRVLEKARQDLKDAVGWYAARNPEVAEAFSRALTELDDRFEEIAAGGPDRLERSRV
jgi:plasmid stabilization system protein ParE